METSKPVWNVYDENCPTRLVLGRIADKWTVLIVGRLARGPLHFGELRREVGGISQKVLTQALRALERDGLVARRVAARSPLRVEYSLTPLGRTLVDMLDQVRRWAEGNIESVLAARKAFDSAAEQADSTSGARVIRLSARQH
jgi:DNA-binding HxlR family transcriptional regulator